MYLYLNILTITNVRVAIAKAEVRSTAGRRLADCRYYEIARSADIWIKHCSFYRILIFDHVATKNYFFTRKKLYLLIFPLKKHLFE